MREIGITIMRSLRERPYETKRGIGQLVSENMSEEASSVSIKRRHTEFSQCPWKDVPLLGGKPLLGDTD
jgi:hypothetical protein